MIKSIANKLLKNYSFLHSYLKIKFLPKKDIDLFLSTWIKKNKEVTIFQIGANDGISGDPFFKYVRVYKLKNLAVEPIPFLFEKLKDNYTKAKLIDKCILLNVGISNGKSATIYYFEPNPAMDIPENIYQLGTFNRDLLNEASLMFPGLKIVSVEVPTFPVKELQQKYFIPDVIHVDTEGYDFEVIKTIDFTNKPRLIIFEFIHLSEPDIEAAKIFLQQKNYRIKTFEMDIVAELV